MQQLLNRSHRTPRRYGRAARFGLGSLAVAAFLLVASCSSGSDEATVTTPKPKEHNPCKMVTTKEVAAGLGQAVADGAPITPSKNELGKTTACGWKTTSGPNAGNVALGVAVHEWADVPKSEKKQGDAVLEDAASYVRWLCNKLTTDAGGIGATDAEDVLLNYGGLPACSTGNSTLLANQTTLVVIEVPSDAPTEAERRATQRIAANIAPRV